MPHMYRVRTVTSGWFGAPGFTTHYYMSSSSPDSTSVGGAGGAVNSVHAFWDICQGLFPLSWRCQVQPTVDIVDALNGEVINAFGVTATPELPGTNGAGYGPTAAMLVLTARTPGFVGGRRVVGRSYIGPAANLSDADGTPSVGLVSGLQGATPALTPPVIDGIAAVVWSRPRAARAAGPGNKPTALTARLGSAHFIDAYSVRDKWGILRSRRD